MDFKSILLFSIFFLTEAQNLTEKLKIQRKHLLFSHIVNACANRDEVCNVEPVVICAAQQGNDNKFIYKEFNSSCHIFFTNMCDYPGNEFSIISKGVCNEHTYIETRRQNDNISVDNDNNEKQNNTENEYEYYSDEKKENKTALRHDVSEEVYDGHKCPVSCTKIYQPTCLSVNRGNGLYFKFYTFINHCLADKYYCDHITDFAPPPNESEENVNASPLSWSYCGAHRYLQFARFSEAASSMSHYGWLLGDAKYNKIMAGKEHAFDFKG